MPYNELNSAQYGSNSSIIKNYEVGTSTLDSPSGKEYKYVNSKAPQQLGYYKQIPELKIAIDTISTWTIGKGYTTPSPLTELTLGVIRGNGKETFDSILENCIRDMYIYGDGYAEIIRDSDGRLVNLKVIDNRKVSIIFNAKGIIIRYEVTSPDGSIDKFNPEDIFHLSRNKTGDEVHGVSIVDVCEWIILARNEAMNDWKTVLHRNVYPVRIWELDTDIDSKINEFKGKVANAKYRGEDMFVPKGTVQTALASLAENASVSPITWIRELNQYFFQAVGVPQIIIGGSQELTQTAAQIAYLSFEQTVEERQLYIEEQVLNQINLEIELTFPASLQNNLLSDLEKDGTQEQQLNQPSVMSPPMLRTGVVQ
jgi:hypothetical protein